ncbi:NADH:flavin oxidoreductase [Secundilactobacillus hailunensis]|uniref:NADH:flavin oxidoreductase n=1 Tax=Secundilactobacillus hailunensis TaxID=2559923 RepID=A0ABW1TAS4_9LACO|nr:NADH:flavin oxidoreductase [Secundilactobacillus hailunensis]
MDISPILKPFKISNKLELQNRIVLAPLDMQNALSDGRVSQRAITFHRGRSRDVGLDVVGSAYVSQDGKPGKHSLSVSRDADIPGLTKLAATIHGDGSKAILQLVHAGRMTTKATTGTPIVAPSAIAAGYGDFPKPTALDEDGINRIIKDFLSATDRAYKAGFDGVELHGASSFLLQQFLSPMSNRRRDQFGVNLVGRLRFATILVTKLVKLAKSLSPNFVVGYRLSPEEHQAEGISLSDTIGLAAVLSHLGIDYLSLSLKNYKQSALVLPEVTNVVKMFSKVVHCPVITVGGINSVDTLTDALNQADLAGVASALIDDPNWVKKLGL